MLVCWGCALLSVLCSIQQMVRGVDKVKSISDLSAVIVYELLLTRQYEALEHFLVSNPAAIMYLPSLWGKFWMVEHVMELMHHLW